MIGPDSSADDIVACLKTLRSETNVAGMARFGIETGTALGISNPDLQGIARTIKRDHDRALALWDSNVREARMLALYTAEPKRLTRQEAWRWIEDFNSWEIVDTAADLFTRTGYWKDLVSACASDEREFVRRTAFAMIAGAAVHNKAEPDECFIAFLPLLEAHATDDRNFVKKAVNWGLRNIGKKRPGCYGPALALAEKLAASPDKTARWIGKDAVRELKAIGSVIGQS
jgi:3-methyladenine DNA glycosylase AlkD